MVNIISIAHAQNDFDFDISNIRYFHKRDAQPNWRVDKIAYVADYVVAYCIRGEAFYYFRDESHIIRKGDLLFFPKELVRTGKANPDDPWSFYSLTFSLRFQDAAMQERFDSLDCLIRNPRLQKLHMLFAEFAQIWKGKRSGYKLKCKSLLLDLLYTMLKEHDRITHGTAHYNAIEKTINLILSRYTEHFNIEELASRSGLSPSHFRLLFKKVTGMTAIQYQNQVRIGVAKDLLMGGECNVTEAALAAGFQDIYYFSRLFKQLTGEPPSRYMKG